MGSRATRRHAFLALATLAVFVLATSLRPAHAGSWGDCDGEDDTCQHSYLNVTTRQGEALLSVDDFCRGAWRHAWFRSDARRTIQQWLNGQAASGTGTLCIPLAGEVSEVRVTSIAGNCGFEDGKVSRPGSDVLLRAGHLSNNSTILRGCHARIGDVAFGGIALDFADGYGFGDSYAAGYFYGVYDGFGRDTVSPTGASLWQISQFNTYHYRVEILANGGIDWRADFEEDDR